MHSTTETAPEFLNVSFTDWERTRHVYLEDVTTTATVAELVEAAREAMDLPPDTAYQAVLDGRQLNHMDTIEEAGIAADTEMEIVPEVHAGSLGEH
jgi:hypothetical protein